MSTPFNMNSTGKPSRMSSPFKAFLCLIHFLVLIDGADITKHPTTEVVVEWKGKQSLKSDGYPYLVQQEKKFLLRTSNNTGYIRMVFDDLDLPKGSFLQVYDGRNSSSPMFKSQPHLTRGSWYRPVIASTGPAIFIIFVSMKPKYNHIGFKATFWSTKDGPEKWTEDKPFTDCPPIHEAMDGGQISLGSIETSQLDPNVRYVFDCVWLVACRYHTSGSDGKEMPPKTFISVLKADLVDGTAEIHSNTNSESDTLLTFKDEKTTNVEGLVPFQSNHGLYVRLRKPLDQGEFKFNYGVFEEAKEKNEEEPHECDFHLWTHHRKQGNTIQGFLCDGSNWCIPREHVCNHINNCPDGSDENGAYCNTTALVLFDVGRAIDRLAKGICQQKLCPDGSCIKEEKECPSYQVAAKELPSCPEGQKYCIDGNCIWKNETCNVTCAKFEDKCDNGMCINSRYESCSKCQKGQKRCKQSGLCIQPFERCPESDCQSWKPWYCANGWQCLYKKQKCDGTVDCRDGSDEWEDMCPKPKGFFDRVKSVILHPIIGIIVFSCFLVACITWRARKNSDPNRQKTPMWGPFAAKKKRKLVKSTDIIESPRSSIRKSPRVSPSVSPRPSPKTSPSHSPYGKDAIEIEVKIVPDKARSSDGYLLATVPEEK